MKTILILLATAGFTLAQDADARNYLTTRTVKTGRDKVIMVAIKQHKTTPIELVLETGMMDKVIKATIPAGEGVVKAQYSVYTGWKATITANGNQIDQETATRKTGLTSIK